MRRHKKQPKIFPEKVRLAQLIKKKWTAEKLSVWSHGFYGTFKSPKGLFRVTVHFQNYVRRLGVEDVCIHWATEEFNHALRPGDIRPLLSKMEKGVEYE